MVLAGDVHVMDRLVKLYCVSFVRALCDQVQATRLVLACIFPSFLESQRTGSVLLGLLLGAGDALPPPMAELLALVPVLLCPEGDLLLFSVVGANTGCGYPLLWPTVGCNWWWGWAEP